jgi:isoamylase
MSVKVVTSGGDTGAKFVEAAGGYHQFHQVPPLGATLDREGCTFAVFSQHAKSIWLCLFDEAEEEIHRLKLNQRIGSVWFRHVQGITVGQLYAFRVEGPENPLPGSCFNANKLLIDPYAKCLNRTLKWDNRLMWMGHYSDVDSAPVVPKSVVTFPDFDWEGVPKPVVSTLNRVIYEVHVKGFTKLHPGVPENLRGTYLGLCSPVIIDYLKSLHITTLQIMPCMAFMSEGRLQDLGLTNYWGYNPVNFFSPDWRFAIEDPVREFKTMVKTLHQAGIEVILDVVYNHTAEGGLDGGMFSFKGFDSLHYYRYTPDRRHLLNYSGCGNSVRVEFSAVLQMVMDSLRYWVEDMQLDGFRFDLAASMGREEMFHGAIQFNPQARFFAALNQDPLFRNVLLVAEPWDVGENGYQMGAFPPPWLEVNDRFRDAVRAFWKGDRVGIAEFATRLMGSRDVFSKSLRPMTAPVNHITYHDGFTLEDLVSYRRRHNEANGEDGRDGHGHNLSTSHGEEGSTQDPAILDKRLQHKRNLIGTLILARGTPHLLGGDERGRTQQGNNNAYCQDNEISWVNWDKLKPYDAEFFAFMVEGLRLRKSFGSINHLYIADETYYAFDGLHKVTWLNKDGLSMSQSQWHNLDQNFVALTLEPMPSSDDDTHHWLILVNGSEEQVTFRIPEEWLDCSWTCVLNSTGVCPVGVMNSRGMQVEGSSMCLWHAGPPI